MNLKRLLDRLGDDVNPLFVLALRTSIESRVFIATLSLVALSVLSSVAFCGPNLPRFVFEMAFGAILFLALYVSTLRDINRIGFFWGDEAIVLTMKVLTRKQVFYGRFFPFQLDGSCVWFTSLPFAGLLSLSGLSFWRLFVVSTTVCLAVGAYVMQMALFSVNEKKGRKIAWAFMIPLLLIICAVPTGLMFHLRWLFHVDATLTPDLRIDGLCFFMTVLTLYCGFGDILCRVHLRWNLGHPWREAIINTSVFGPFGIAVFWIGYALFG